MRFSAFVTLTLLLRLPAQGMLTCPKEMPIATSMVKLLRPSSQRGNSASRLGIAIDQTAFGNAREYAGSAPKQQAKGLASKSCKGNPEQEGQLPNIDLHRPELKKNSLPDSYGSFSSHSRPRHLGLGKPKAVGQLPEEGSSIRQTTTKDKFGSQNENGPIKKGNWSGHSAFFASH